MKPIFILLFLLAIWTQTCKKQKLASPEQIFKHWVHSFEEDKQGTQFYRPASYTFPLSRGREGFEIKENGEFIFYGIGAADGMKKMNGKWTANRNGAIHIEFNTSDIDAFNIQVLQVSDTLLTIRKQTN